MSLLKSVRKVLRKNLGIRNGEKVLIVSDARKMPIAKIFLAESNKLTQSKLIIMPIASVDGAEPPKNVSVAMLRCDVGILLTSRSLTHTKARRLASKNSRIASMPNISRDTLTRALNINYDQLNALNRKLSAILSKGDKVLVQTKLGTDLVFSIRGRHARDLDDGVFRVPGDFGNLPAGESYIAPVETSAQGVFVVDGSIAGIGMVDQPVKVFMKDGFAFRVSGGVAARKFDQMMNKVGKKARTIAEFGIGTNPRAKITGNLLEDEKVKGTCHFAVGNSKSFGGVNDVAFHVDSVVQKPTIFVDGRKIMIDGKLL